MYFHSQNLNDEIPKKYWLNGRCWIGQSFQWNIEWTLPSRGFDISLDLNDYGETAIRVRISLWLFSLYIGIEWQPLYRLLEKITRRKGQKYTNGRCIGISWYAGTLNIDLWYDPMEWRSGDPKWWHMSFDFNHLLKGKPKFSEETLETREILVPMPEKAYKATATRTVRRWKYPRWFTSEVMSVNLDFEEGVPFEGKGENSWDCGPDATSSFSCPAKTIPDAVGEFVGSLLNRRIRYGGWGDWEWKK